MPKLARRRSKIPRPQKSGTPGWDAAFGQKVLSRLATTAQQRETGKNSEKGGRNLRNGAGIQANVIEVGAAKSIGTQEDDDVLSRNRSPGGKDQRRCFRKATFSSKGRCIDRLRGEGQSVVSDDVSGRCIAGNSQIGGSCKNAVSRGVCSIRLSPTVSCSERKGIGGVGLEGDSGVLPDVATEVDSNVLRPIRRESPDEFFEGVSVSGPTTLLPIRSEVIGPRRGICRQIASRVQFKTRISYGDRCSLGEQRGRPDEA
jgi:hypothetical protein